MRGVAVFVLALSACSFTGVERARHVAPGRVECHADFAVPLVDTLVALGSYAEAIHLYSEAMTESESSAPLSAGLDRRFAAPWVILATVSAASAIYGFTTVQGCEREAEESRVAQRAEAERAQARSQAQAAAWAATRQAAESARAGDCATVTKLDADVRTLDADFHATVFSRDVAIAHCLGH